MASEREKNVIRRTGEEGTIRAGKATGKEQRTSGEGLHHFKTTSPDSKYKGSNFHSWRITDQNSGRIGEERPADKKGEDEENSERKRAGEGKTGANKKKSARGHHLKKASTSPRNGKVTAIHSPKNTQP